jgi:hypothetical protein
VPYAPKRCGQLLEGREQAVSYLILELPPQPLQRVECRARGREKYGRHIRWPSQGFGFVKRALVQHEQIKGIRKGLCAGVDPELAGVGVEPREFQKEARSRARFDGPIKRTIVEPMPYGGNGVAPARRDPPPDEREQTHPTFVLGQDFYWGLWGTGDTLLSEERWELCLKRGDSLQPFFAWDGRGRFGFARKVPRTKA